MAFRVTDYARRGMLYALAAILLLAAPWASRPGPWQHGPTTTTLAVASGWWPELAG